MSDLRPPGCPPGVARNPIGMNQHDPNKRRGAAYAFRLPIELNEQFLSLIDEKGLS